MFIFIRISIHHFGHIRDNSTIMNAIAHLIEIHLYHLQSMNINCGDCCFLIAFYIDIRTNSDIQDPYTVILYSICSFHLKLSLLHITNIFSRKKGVQQ